MKPRLSSVHAVVWRQPGGAVPAALADALSRQGITFEAACGPFDALSRVFHARARGDEARVLLLVEPETLPDQEAVRVALDRYDPQARCWAYRERGSPKLGPLPVPPPPSEPEIVVRQQPRPKPQLRLTDDPPPREAATDALSDDDGPEAQAPSDSPRSILTPEELEMLLADDRS